MSSLKKNNVSSPLQSTILHKDILSKISIKNVANTNIKNEPRRDWRLWLLSGHRLRVIIYTITGIIILYVLQSILWPKGSSPHTLFGEVWSYGSLLWVSQLITCILALIGILSFSFPDKLDHVKPIDKIVSFRIVSRGTNIEALKILYCVACMR